MPFTQIAYSFKKVVLRSWILDSYLHSTHKLKFLFDNFLLNMKESLVSYAVVLVSFLKKLLLLLNVERVFVYAVFHQKPYEGFLHTLIQF